MHSYEKGQHPESLLLCAYRYRKGFLYAVDAPPSELGNMSEERGYREDRSSKIAKVEYQPLFFIDFQSLSYLFSSITTLL